MQKWHSRCTLLSDEKNNSPQSYMTLRHRKEHIDDGCFIIHHRTSDRLASCLDLCATPPHERHPCEVGTVQRHRY